MWFPESMAAYPQFVVYRVFPSKTRPGKTDKIPVDPYTGSTVDGQNPTNWLDAQTAAALVATGAGDGIGFVFTDQDPFFFLDIDGALQPDGQWSELARGLCGMFGGCFMEVSHSGSGLHIIGTAEPIAHRKRDDSNHLELYTSKRFVAMTGNGAQGDARTVAQDAFNWLVGQYFQQTDGGDRAADWTTEPVAEWDGPTDDQELILKMLSAKGSTASAFGNKSTLQDLWGANVESLAVNYPDPAREFDHSKADAALCQHLAFWTGKDCERMDRLFRQSGLYREKWERRQDYRENTILKAVGRCTAVYSGSRRDEPTTALTVCEQPTVEPQQPAGEHAIRGGSQMMSINQQVDYFRGCVYIQQADRIFTPDGSLLNTKQFRATYGGYSFVIDVEGRKDTRNAWEVFTESQGYFFPKVHAASFRPELASGAIIEEEGQRLVNTYVPIATAQRPGDPGPFLDLLARILPIERDRDILLAYMAAVVQYPGVKFQWCPLVQGVEGNGKSLIIRCLEFAVGSRYTHLPAAQDISNKFNAWILNKLFVGIEEIYVADRQEALDALKPLITNPRIDIQGKGDNQKTGDNRANIVATSNHQDAVRKTQTDRRYCVFYTAQQKPGDLERDGMGGDYFPRLYAWLKAEGYAVINGFLRSYAIPDELNPATNCHRAPETSTTAAAIRASLGGIEQDILEAIEQDQPGFSGGWISSLAFDRMLEKRRSNISRNRRKEILEGLGYQHHPALRGGRVHNPIDDCGFMGKPVLYIRNGHIHGNLTSGADIARCYQEAQKSGAAAENAAVMNF